VGQKAVLLAGDGRGGVMATILRDPGSIYSVRYGDVPLDVVANSERAFPARWIAPGGADVTDEFIAYARPLIGDDWVRVPLADGLPRFARLAENFADKQLPAYVPQAYRQE
jgi:hypothetical protein